MKKDLKQTIISFCNCYGTATTESISGCIATYMENQGLKAYNGCLLPGIQKGHWKAENKLKVYSDECSLPNGSGSLRITISKYGIKDKTLYYSIDNIELNPLDRDSDRDAHIWADLNDGIVGKEYK